MYSFVHTFTWLEHSDVAIIFPLDLTIKRLLGIGDYINNVKVADRFYN